MKNQKVVSAQSTSLLDQHAAATHSVIDRTILKVLPERFPDIFPRRPIGEKHHLYDANNPGQTMLGLVCCSFGIYSLLTEESILQLSYGAAADPTHHELEKENALSVQATAKRAFALLKMDKRQTIPSVSTLVPGAVAVAGMKDHLLVMQGKNLDPALCSATLLHICMYCFGMYGEPKRPSDTLLSWIEQCASWDYKQDPYWAKLSVLA